MVEKPKKAPPLDVDVKLDAWGEYQVKLRASGVRTIERAIRICRRSQEHSKGVREDSAEDAAASLLTFLENHTGVAKEDS